jgi:phosphopantothenoylcysteine decarboxylase/phosphopantothenate--cysteine ligase
VDRPAELSERTLSMKIVLGVTGSIAAYRSPDLLKALVKAGHEVSAVLTRAAAEFVTPKTLETFSARKVWGADPFGPDHLGTDHIELARWADLILVYGATADFLHRYAHGAAADFLNLQLLATRAPVIVAPAMNPDMWLHPAVQTNAALLQSRGVQFVGPIGGLVACGEVGIGHVASIEDIVQACVERVEPLLSLAGQRVLISAGPMRTSIDPVRSLQNKSSGLMGLETARAAARAGAQVTVLLGPVETQVARAFEGFETHRYEGPADYAVALDALFPKCDIFLSLAAVLDFEVQAVSKKIDRRALGSALPLAIKSVPDHVARVAASKRPEQRVIAFAAETGTESEILERAARKGREKGVDAIVANPVWPGLGPESADNQLWVLREGKAPHSLGPAPKSRLASPLLRALFG